MKKPRTATFDLICQVCGRHFIAKTSCAMYCPDCKVTKTKIHQKQSAEKMKAIHAEEKARKKNRKPNQEILEIVKKATEKGVSYGRYVAESRL